MVTDVIELLKKKLNIASAPFLSSAEYRLVGSAAEKLVVSSKDDKDILLILGPPYTPEYFKVNFSCFICSSDPQLFHLFSFYFVILFQWFLYTKTAFLILIFFSTSVCNIVVFSFPFMASIHFSYSFLIIVHTITFQPLLWSLYPLIFELSLLPIPTQLLLLSVSHTSYFSLCYSYHLLLLSCFFV